MSLDEIIAKYIAQQRCLGKRFSAEATLLAAFKSAVSDVPLRDIRPAMISRFVDRGGTSDQTKHKKYRVVSGLFRFAVTRQLLKKSPMPRRPRMRWDSSYTPYIYSEAELKRLLAAVPTATAGPGCVIDADTLRTFLLLLYGAALRRGEALRLKLEDVDVAQSLIHIRGAKFFKTRIVPLSASLAGVIRTFVARGGKQHSVGSEGTLFLQRDRKPLNDSTIGHTFRRLCSVAGIRRDGGARNQPRMHDLRHSAAVHRVIAWYRCDADLNDLLPKLATYLGHAELSGTQRYLTMTQELLAEAGRRFEAFAGEAVMTDRTALGHWVRRFLLEYAASERNLSANTCASYRDMLVLLLPYAAKRKRVAADALSVTDLSAELVRSFLVYLEQERECCTATRNQRLASIHALARFIGKHSPQDVEWCTQIRMVPIKKGIITSLTYLEKSEVDALLAAPDQSSTQGRRDHALLLFLYNSGARVSEAASLRIGDIDWHSKSVRITGKGNKQRRCPLWVTTLAHVRHLAWERPAEVNLFVNRRGEPLTRYGIHTLVERYVTKLRASVPSLQGKRISPHVIRHTTASHLLQAGVDINTIRAWLGHVSLDTTNIYAETDLATKKRALATLARGKTLRTTGGWSRQPDVMAFLRTL